MRLEFEPNASALPLVEDRNVKESAPSEAEQLLREGVKSAQEGRRSEAKTMLLQAVEVEPNNENAWLWLASISEYPEELLVFLNNVLKINPQNERAIEWKKATQSLLSKTLVQRGVDASKDDRKEFAKQCFEQAVEHDAENEMAWLWMASVADSDSEKIRMFEKVLSINPENETAQVSLQSLQSQRAESLLHNAISEAIEGRHENSQHLLADLLEKNDSLEDAWVLKAHLAESFEERAECLLKIRSLNPENEMAKAWLASWRLLVERAAPQMPEARENEFFADLDESADLSAENEPQAESELMAESEAKEESEPKAELAPISEPVQPEILTEKYSFAGEYASPDSPTQDLNTFSQPASPEAVVEETLAETDEIEPLYEDFQDSPVSFENESAVENLAAEIAADENEMSSAFSETPEKSESAEEFNSFLSEIREEAAEAEESELSVDSSDSPETNDVLEIAAADSSESTEMSAELTELSIEDALPSEQPALQSEEEWRNTSPEVFAGYATKFAETPESEMSAQEEKESQEIEPQAVSASEETEIQAVSETEPQPISQDFSETVSTVSSEEPEAEISMMPEEVGETVAESKSATIEKTEPFRSEMMYCPFCNADNEKQSFQCQSCQAVLSLTDLDALLNHSGANEEVLQQAVASFEREHESYGLSPEQLAYLGIGQINLKNYRQGYLYLQESVQSNPSNVVLDAQVNALAIRLAEMEKQQSVHDSMPKNRKILVVDDSPTVRKLISSKLEKCGHEVVCAVDGLDALEKLNHLTPDLILLDITMPRMDGYQVCKLIRNNADTKEVPVVMISGKDGFFDKVRGRMAGTTDYITKPFGPETLMKTVDNYLD